MAVSPRGGARERRGFTLLELVTVVAIVTLLGGLAMMSFDRARAAQAHDESARDLTGFARRARALATTGVNNVNGSGPAAAPPAAAPPAAAPPRPGGPGATPQSMPPVAAMRAPVSNVPVRYTGLRVIDTRTVELFAILEDTSRVVLDNLSFAAEYPESNLVIVNPAPGSEIRFRKNGTRDVRFPGQLQVRDQDSGRVRTIDINAAGLADIN